VFGSKSAAEEGGRGGREGERRCWRNNENKLRSAALGRALATAAHAPGAASAGLAPEFQEVACVLMANDEGH
jgi:hypothetical protein